MVTTNLIKNLIAAQLGLQAVSGSPVPQDHVMEKRSGSGYIEQKFNSSYRGIGQFAPIAQIEIGTPLQLNEFLIDTGSNVAYVVGKNESCQDFSSEETTISCDSHFDASESCTYNSTTDLRYGTFGSAEGTYQGYWGNDKAQWGGADFEFDFVYSYLSEAVAILGTDVRSALTEGGILQNLQTSGAIKAKTFATYYEDLYNLRGTLMLGAIDHSKYIGDLIEVPYSRTFQIGGYKLKINNDTEVTLSDEYSNRMFDTGGINFHIHPSAYAALQQALGDDNGEISCEKIRTLDPVIEVSIANLTTIGWPVKDFISDNCTTVTELKHVSVEEFNQGPQFFKYAYVVWDYEHERMLIGERNPDPGSPDIEVIEP